MRGPEALRTTDPAVLHTMVLGAHAMPALAVLRMTARVALAIRVRVVPHSMALVVQRIAARAVPLMTVPVELATQALAARAMRALAELDISARVCAARTEMPWVPRPELTR